jgi:hypothetical protein
VVFSVVDVPCGNVADLCGNELCWTAIPGFSPRAVTVYFIMAIASGRNIVSSSGMYGGGEITSAPAASSLFVFSKLFVVRTCHCL